MRRPARFDALDEFDVVRAAAAAQRPPEVLRLEILETELAPPAVALAAARAALDAGEGNAYLPFTGRRELREAVAERLLAQTGCAYDPETEIVVTGGGMLGMLNALLATVGPGQEVIVTDPAYAGMLNRVRLAGASTRSVPFVRDGGAWRLDLDALTRAAGPATGAVFLMSPSMPSGAVLDDAEWEAVAEVCRERDVPLIYNAAMERVLYDGRRSSHPAALEGMRERTLTVGSASKEHRMVGWRIGWVTGPRALIADVVVR